MLWEVIGATVGLRYEGQGVEAELDIVLLIEVDELVCFSIVCGVFLWFFPYLNGLLSPHFVDHCNSAVFEFDLLAMRLVVLAEGFSN